MVLPGLPNLYDPCECKKLILMSVLKCGSHDGKDEVKEGLGKKMVKQMHLGSRLYECFP